MEQEDCSFTQNGMEQNKNGMIKKEQEWNDLAEDPRS